MTIPDLIFIFTGFACVLALQLIGLGMITRLISLMEEQKKERSE